MAHYRMLFLAAAATLLAYQALAQDAQVMHWWTSGGESRAVAVFAKEYEKRGGKWIDGASVGPQAEHAAVLNAIAGGNPPAAFQWNIGVAVRQLAEQGLLANLDDLARAGDWSRHLPPLLVKNITVDGHVIAVPVNLHGANWMFYSTKVFSDLNMAPPKTWEEFLAQADKIKAAGYLPIAMGGNSQQTGWLFYAMLAGCRRQGGLSQDLCRSRRGGGRQRKRAACLRDDGQNPPICRCRRQQQKVERHLGLGRDQQGRLYDRRRLGQGRLCGRRHDPREGVWLSFGTRYPGCLCHDRRRLCLPESHQAGPDRRPAQARGADDGPGSPGRVQQIQGIAACRASMPMSAASTRAPSSDKRSWPGATPINCQTLPSPSARIRKARSRTC